MRQFGLVQDGIFHQTKRLVNIDRDVLWTTLSGWNFFHESVKKFNEVMCVTNDNWTPIPMYCSNCGELLYGYRNDEGKIKYECKRCGTVAVRVQKGRRHDKIDLYAPEGQVRYYWSDKTEYGKTTEWLRWNRLRNSISRSLALNTSVG